MKGRLIFQIFLFLSLGIMSAVSAQAGESKESTSKYSVQIDLSEAYIGGICILKGDGDLLNVSIVNEFGVSLISLMYEHGRGKVKIVNCVKQLRNPFIKKVLKKDFKMILTEYMDRNTVERLPIHHVNLKHNITYNLIPL